MVEIPVILRMICNTTLIAEIKLSTVDSCVLWGSRVVIPAQGSAIVLEQLHDTHPGTNQMKSLARSYAWWPHLHCDIVTKVILSHLSNESSITPKGSFTPMEMAL